MDLHRMGVTLSCRVRYDTIQYRLKTPTQSYPTILEQNRVSVSILLHKTIYLAIDLFSMMLEEGGGKERIQEENRQKGKVSI
jgi:hypothetical protein